VRLVQVGRQTSLYKKIASCIVLSESNVLMFALLYNSALEIVLSNVKVCILTTLFNCLESRLIRFALAVPAQI